MFWVFGRELSYNRGSDVLNQMSLTNQLIYAGL